MDLPPDLCQMLTPFPSSLWPLVAFLYTFAFFRPITLDLELGPEFGQALIELFTAFVAIVAAAACLFGLIVLGLFVLFVVYVVRRSGTDG